MALLLVVFVVAGRMIKEVPGRLQNAVEFIWESLENWAVSLGGPDARRHIPLFAAFFLFILFSNWSGLLPFFGKIEALRAPTSDVNVTIGLALVAFFYFHYQGFRTPRRARLPRQVLRLHGLQAGHRRPASSTCSSGLIEFLLEFIKPVTLAMRLFGNIFGGEVALGVITALTIALVPVGMLLLEGLLNFVQALIFSTLMLMYTIIAVESHHEEEHGRRSPTCPRVAWRRRSAWAQPVTSADQPGTTRRPRDGPAARNGGRHTVEYIGAGLAALGVIGPGIGIGILTGLAATAIGRNPDATPQIRAQFILGAAFAEGLGVLAIVVAILAIVLQPAGVSRHTGRTRR